MEIPEWHVYEYVLLNIIVESHPVNIEHWDNVRITPSYLVLLMDSQLTIWWPALCGNGSLTDAFWVSDFSL